VIPFALNHVWQSTAFAALVGLVAWGCGGIRRVLDSGFGRLRRAGSYYFGVL